MTHHPRLNVGIYLAVFVALCDQISKWLIVTQVRPPLHGLRLTPWLNLVLVWNKGMIFGLLGHFDPHIVRYVLLAVAAIILFFLGRWLLRTSSTAVALGLGCIMGGAFGNVIDRLNYGAVADFIDVHAGRYHWYAFNLADAAIDLGIALLLLDSFRQSR